MGKRRTTKDRRKLFERLPNEIYADIFSYLNGVDIVYTFGTLNHRFRCLINEFCRFIDLQSISRKQLKFLFKNYSTKQWKSLRISDDNRTPDCVNYFYQYYFLRKDFSQLESFAIFNLDLQKTYPICSQFSLLKNLVSLTMGPVCGTRMTYSFDLPNLKKLVLNSCPNLHWIENFPQLESIEYTSNACHTYPDTFFVWPLKLKYLKILFTDNFPMNHLIDSFVRLLSLLSLEVYEKSAGISPPNGQLWENLISSSLPLLRTFKVFFQFLHLENLESYDEIIKSFSSKFYLNERHWFIYHDIPYKYPNHFVLLNSFAFAFQEYSSFGYSLEECITTVANDRHDKFYVNIYKNIQTVTIQYQTDQCNEHFLESSIRNLFIRVNFDLISWLPVLTRLKHLEIFAFPNLSSKDFQLLLNNSPYLDSLKIDKSLLQALTKNWTDPIICKHLTEKILSLEFFSNSYRINSTSQNEIQQIIRIFQRKCQHLSITIQLPNDIIITQILQNMSQLKSLYIHISGYHYQPFDSNWLENQQKKFSCFILNKISSYYFWF